MLKKDRKELENLLHSKFETMMKQPSKYTVLADKLRDICGMSRTKSLDYMTGRCSLSDANEIELYYLATIFNIDVDKFFSEREKKNYSNYIFEEKSNQMKFPIVIDCHQVSSDQYIGVTDVNFFIELRRCQMINYNENSQRVMQRIVRNGSEHYQITINETAVSDIMESFKTNGYIPNVITLNIPQDSEDMSYDNMSNCLIINSLDHFDIIDGYHRYQAMCRLKDNDENFNYPMMIQITNFSEVKARQFIFQEDQKTKMSKVDSNSYNMSSPANIVCEKLNDDVLFNYKGQLSRNDGLIKFGEFAMFIDYFYFKNAKKSDVLSIQIAARKEIKDWWNQVSEECAELLSHKFNFGEIGLIFVAYTRRNEADIFERISNTIISKASELKKFNSANGVRKGIISQLTDLL